MNTITSKSDIETFNDLVALFDDLTGGMIQFTETVMPNARA